MDWLQVWQDDEGTELLLGDLESLPQSYLQESDIANSRNREKAAIQRILEEKFPKKSILKDSFGKPFLSESNVHINYSHSPSFVFWGSNPERPIGVDVESTRETLRKVAHKFCNQTEWKFADDGQDISKLLLIWSAKESLFKAYGKGEIDFKKQLFIEPTELQQQGVISGGLHLNITYHCTIHYQYINEGICTWTLWPKMEQKAG